MTTNTIPNSGVFALTKTHPPFLLLMEYQHIKINKTNDGALV